MQTMIEREEPHQLPGFVQIDDAYLGGERNGGKPGRGAENKQPFVVAVAIDATLERPTFTVIEPVRRFDNASLTDWSQRCLTPDAEVLSDGLGCFRRVVELDHAHTVLENACGCAVTETKGARWVNVVLGNVKRAISGSCHVMRQAKYARRCLAEAAYRFSRRFRLAELLPRLVRAMVPCKPWPESKLRVVNNFHG